MLKFVQMDLHLNELHNYRKSHFVLKTIEKSTFLTPRRLEHRSKIAPRRLQEVTFSLLNFAPLFLIDFCSVLAPQMPPFGHPFCSQNRSQAASGGSF